MGRRTVARQLDGWRIADVGAGVNALPFVLAERGARVVTIDNHPVVRDMASRADWNEWGFLDYAALDARIQSRHVAYEMYKSDELFDCIYSVSVIEHVSKATRRRWIDAFSNQLRPGGLLLLTVDLVLGGDALWNLSEGRTGRGCGRPR